MTKTTGTIPRLNLLTASKWKDYELLDSGNGLKLERYGNYTFVRPEPEAIWRPLLPEKAWKDVHGVFQATGEEHGGHWLLKKNIPPRWQMTYENLNFWVQTSAARHLGVFPEQASHWDWANELIENAGRPIQVLNLFGYTGIASLAAAQAGAKVTHVDASKKSISWARENQELSNLADRPIRWILDDALKFVQREARRGAQYDGIILDPPKFGRGPKGEVWEFYKLIPSLLQDCRDILSSSPLFVCMTAYAIKASSLTIYQAMQEMMQGCQGQTTAGELISIDSSGGRTLSHAIYARWSESN